MIKNVWFAIVHPEPSTVKSLLWLLPFPEHCAKGCLRTISVNLHETPIKQERILGSFYKEETESWGETKYAGSAPVARKQNDWDLILSSLHSGAHALTLHQSINAL